MLRIRTILVPTDYSTVARRAYDHARYIAERYAAELHVLHVSEQVEPGVSERMAHSASYAEARPVVPAVRRVRRAHRRGASVPATILAYAEEIDADLIVLGTEGRSGARRIVLGSTAEEVVTRAPCPVLTVRAGGTSVPGMDVRHLLVAVDFSGVSHMLVRHAQELAAAYGADLDLLHVIEEPGASAFYRIDEFQSRVPAVATHARQALIELARGGARAVSTRYHVLVGRPARDILDFAEAQDTDLILLGVGHARGDRFGLLGGVAEQVVRRAPCLVATVREDGKNLVDRDRLVLPWMSKRMTPRASLRVAAEAQRRGVPEVRREARTTAGAMQRHSNVRGLVQGSTRPLALRRVRARAAGGRDRTDSCPGRGSGLRR